MQATRRDDPVHGQGDGTGSDEVQDLGVSYVQGDAEGLREDGSALWNTLIGYVRIHNAHLQARGPGASTECPLCQGGVERLADAIEGGTVDDGYGVVQGGGTDEEGAAAPPPVDGAPDDLEHVQDGWYRSAGEDRAANVADSK